MEASVAVYHSGGCGGLEIGSHHPLLNHLTQPPLPFSVYPQQSSRQWSATPEGLVCHAACVALCVLGVLSFVSIARATERTGHLSPNAPKTARDI